MTRNSSEKLIIIDESVLALDWLGIDNDLADPSHVVAAVKEAKQAYPQDVSVIFIVCSKKEKESEAVIDFNQKERKLTAYFGEDKEIVSQVLPQKRACNLYRNILHHRNIAAENVLYVTHSVAYDEDVAAVEIETLWSRLHADPRERIFKFVQPV